MVMKELLILLFKSFLPLLDKVIHFLKSLRELLLYSSKVAMSVPVVV